MLPYVVLKGAGVAIGRGKEALWAVGGGGGGGSGGTARGTPRSLLAIGGDRQLSEALARNLGFVEVADGRVSRLHCIISLRGGRGRGSGGGGGEGAKGEGERGRAVLEDCSSNGTFINGTKIGKGETGEGGGGCAGGAEGAGRFRGGGFLVGMGAGCIGMGNFCQG